MRYVTHSGQSQDAGQPPSLAAFCSTQAGGQESKARDAFRPDALRRLRRAAEDKGGAAWRRDRSHAQPRAGPLGPSMASMARTHPLPVASTAAPPIFVAEKPLFLSILSYDRIPPEAFAKKPSFPL